MAYARYTQYCAWYVFWHSTWKDEARARQGRPKAKAEETLAIWHKDHRAKGPLFTYAEVTEMLHSSDFSRIPGYTDTAEGAMTQWLSRFVRDVDQKYGEDLR